ncbi:TIGR02302 family protein [Palleronia sediminis]|uniref:TIGR02302 family protein n=1 Tax=Palleronia sediminis TaxID=2547833 RepID=A0A4R6A654_9RHOB|nr:TIGR02302 family protein [Palleronia sediminis]TDL76273.1 TIGR02302 family protein [Palleronia sediminis]
MRLPAEARAGLRRPLTLTRLGMAAERAARAFWPVWSVAIAALAALMLGVQDALSSGALRIAAGVVLVALLAFAVLGIRRFAWPTEAQALDRLDRSLPGRPIAALSDSQAIGGADAGSRAVWEAHVTRMAERIRHARATAPDLRIASRDPYALRYAALLALAVALLFGSALRIGSVAGIAPGGGAASAAMGPSWEGWIEPPAYTGRPSLYLADLPSGPVEVPEASRVTIRTYGGDPGISETVSGRPVEAAPEKPATGSVGFAVVQSGEIEIDGPGGRRWSIAMKPDIGPTVEVTGPPERADGGLFSQEFTAGDDHGVVSGKVVVTLDLDAVERMHGLAPAPDPRDPIVADLPLPISGDRAAIAGAFIEDFSQHPWANLPVTLTYEVEDELGQSGQSRPAQAELAGLRFFDPVARAIIEQRRDLLWSRDNADRVARLLRAVSWEPQDVFRSETLYLRLRTAIRRLEAGRGIAELTPERQDEIAAALWDIATEIEFGDLDDARERLRRAQERLSQAMENGADPAEIAELMQELREAMDDFIRQLAEQSQRDGEQQQAEGETQEMSPDQLQQMMDEIQSLMEQGRMAEAQRLMEQLNRMLENMRVTQGQQGQAGQQPGQEALEDLQDTLRDQQGLSDEAFRELQEQFGQQGQPQQPGQQGQDGQQGQPGQRGNQPGEGQGQDGRQPGDGQGGQEGEGTGESLADRQQALRDELNRQRGNLPGAGTEEGRSARENLDRAEGAMEGAEDALREGDNATALDRQAEAMDALRDGLRDLGEALAQERSQQDGQGQARAEGEPNGQSRDPLGREAGRNGEFGTDEQMLDREDVRRRAEELLGEIRRRSGDQTRPEAELDYLRRLLDRF